MSFVEAMIYMLEGFKVVHPQFVNSEYIYINKENKIVNQLGYSVTIDTNSEGWTLYRC